MNAIDLPTLHARLNEVTDALGGRRVTPEGLKTWLSVLHDFPLPHVVDVLTGWAKFNAKAPVPHDVYKQLCDHRSDRMERDAAVRKGEYAADAARTFRRDPKFAAAIHELAVGMAMDTVKDDPKDWARIIYQRFLTDRPGNDGKPLTHVSVEFALSALRITIEQAKEERDERRFAAATQIAA